GGKACQRDGSGEQAGSGSGAWTAVSGGHGAFSLKMAEIRGLCRSWGLKIMKPEVHDNTSGALALYRERTMTTKDGQRGRTVLLGAVFATFTQGTALGHHSPAAFDTSREITVAGTIIEYSFRNPHVYMTL